MLTHQLLLKSDAFVARANRTDSNGEGHVRGTYTVLRKGLHQTGQQMCGTTLGR
jgi:hypothetical protein